MTRGAMAEHTVSGLIGLMLVRNEGGRYLRETLTDLLSYSEQVVVLDDGSTDNTPEVLAELSRLHPHLHLRFANESTFWANESALRQRLWDEARALDPKWIACLDADELLEPGWKSQAAEFLAEAERRNVGLVSFNLFEFWGDRRHYRVDGFWNPQGRYVPVIVRYRPGFAYVWSRRPLHCGRLPVNHPGEHLRSSFRLKHYGWANPADHRRKYERYLQADPAGRYCALSHYRSILSPPVLAEWRD